MGSEAVVLMAAVAVAVKAVAVALAGHVDDGLGNYFRDSVALAAFSVQRSGGSCKKLQGVGKISDWQAAHVCTTQAFFFKLCKAEYSH